MVTMNDKFDGAKSRQSAASPNDDIERQMEARREIDSWLSEGRSEPTAEQLESVTRAWQD